MQLPPELLENDLAFAFIIEQAGVYRGDERNKLMVKLSYWKGMCEGSSEADASYFVCLEMQPPLRFYACTATCGIQQEFVW